ncbi:MAG: hypothetical protein KDC34_03535 [Saprospiraceae bacterium]|nr:hypothetical protein [Saprospiraceae bacterium]
MIQRIIKIGTLFCLILSVKAAAQIGSISFDSLLQRTASQSIPLPEKMEYAKEALALATLSGDTLNMYRAMSELGIIELNMGQFEDCLKTQLHAIRLADQMDSLSLFAKTAYKIGNTHLRMNHPEEAKKWM